MSPHRVLVKIKLINTCKALKTMAVALVLPIIIITIIFL